ncbi:MAG: prolipoprotein diacylglyceryl transferase [Armatimonadota bacterium]|nr:prolipoprotein diacylglyceryl transferase [Armatimonadota bacterium]MDR7423083.1 prolipoprotein diacylglyceryl transferase [Armatimonadota bacterium]MDR7453430.1 prolipoprotein diacylglyceryl transferase [Armatimonadota bacterium]MDR7457340.1 prolipoprotein diacylglyceryl transferase [Armatimonadota bacterium]MDR7495658.1 prolipoprotein diacylglyceryl transferase [Armatimonadota bacterium]
MRPVLFDLFGVIPVSSFGVFLLLGFFAGITIARRTARERLDLDPNQVLDLSLYLIIAGIVAGRLGFIVANPEAFLTDPARMLTLWRDGGLTYYGALLGGLWLAWAFAQRWRVAFGALADAYAPALIAGYAVAMIGALLHGLFVGRPTGVPWAMELFLERRHPAPLYLLAAAAGILAILRAQRHRDLPPGTLLALAVLLQSVARFAVDVFVDAPAVLGPLTAGQVASGVAVLVCAVVLVRLQRRAPQAAEPPAGPPPEPPSEVPA